MVVTSSSVLNSASSSHYVTVKPLPLNLCIFLYRSDYIFILSESPVSSTLVPYVFRLVVTRPCYTFYGLRYSQVSLGIAYAFMRLGVHRIREI